MLVGLGGAMSSSIALWMVLALLAFWCVGLYSRLQRIHARREEALESLHKHVQPYANLVLTHLAGNDPAPTTLRKAAADPRLPSGWAHLLQALVVLDGALLEAKRASAGAHSVLTLSNAMSNVLHAWHTLCAMPPDLAGSAVPDGMRMRWDALTERVELARSQFNQISTKYNEAITQFPARVIARRLGFRPAGVI